MRPAAMLRMLLLATALGALPATAVRADVSISPGVINYGFDAQIAKARAALRLANKALADALAQSKTLLAKAKATTDQTKQVAYLTESVSLLQGIAKLRQQIALLEASLKSWGIAKEVYENQVAAAKLDAERLQQEQLAVEQAKLGTEVKIALLPAINDPFGPTPPEQLAENLLVSGLQKALLADPAQKRAAEQYGIYAVLVNNAYGVAKDELDLPTGWTENKSLHQDLNSGFKADVLEFRDPSGNLKEVVIAFAGTDSWVDHVTGNAGAAIPVLGPIFGTVLSVLDVQPRQAAALANEVLQTYKSEPGVTFRTTGHSLGGALAKFAANEIGVAEAITFDSSPRGPEGKQIAQIEESGEILDVIRLNRSVDVTFNFVDKEGIFETENHTSQLLMAKVLGPLDTTH